LPSSISGCLSGQIDWPFFGLLPASFLGFHSSVLGGV